MSIWEQVIERPDWPIVIRDGIRVILIIILAWVFRRIALMSLGRYQKKLWREAGVEEGQIKEMIKRPETLFRLLRRVITFTVWAVAGLMILRELGMSIAPILASAGIVGLGLGFGAQYYVRDIIAGCFIIMENQVRMNDVAIVNGTGGLVEQINLRTLVLRDLSGIVHVFPNGTINTLSNLTKEWSAYVFDIGVSYKEDTDRVVDILKRTGTELRADAEFGPLIREDVEIFGVDQFADSAVVIKGRLITEPIKQWAVGREYLRRVKKAFDAENVEIPFPHQSIYFGEASRPFLAKLMDEDRHKENLEPSRKD